MVHAIDIPKEDQMMHLFVWRNCSDQNPIETYAMTAVNMGDRSSATIAQLAIKKTVEIEQETHPEAAKTILNIAYMDDVLGSTETAQCAQSQMKDIGTILEAKGFHIKEWIHNLSNKETLSNPQRSIEVNKEAYEHVYLPSGGDIETEGVLGLQWNTTTDDLALQFKPVVKQPDTKVTKRAC